MGSIDPISLELLNLKLPNGQFLIPTSQNAEGRVTGTALSTYHEEQFNTNLDYRAGTRDSLTGKFFFAHAPLFSALSGSNFGTSASLPGFGTQITIDNRVLSLEEIHTFSPTAVNEVRFGHSFIRHDELPQESVKDGSLEFSARPQANIPACHSFFSPVTRVVVPSEPLTSPIAAARRCYLLAIFSLCNEESRVFASAARSCTPNGRHTRLCFRTGRLISRLLTTF